MKKYKKLENKIAFFSVNTIGYPGYLGDSTEIGLLQTLM